MPHFTSVTMLSVVLPYKKVMGAWLGAGPMSPTLQGDSYQVGSDLYTNKACFNLVVI